MYGSGFAAIERDDRGTAVRLIPINTPSVQVKRHNNGHRYYKIIDGGIIEAENMLHVSNLFDASPIDLHRQNIGLSIAAKEYGSQFFGNGGQMTGILASDQPLNNTQMDTMQGSWNASSTVAGVKLLPFGFKYTPVSVPPEAIQFIETQKFQIEEIARIFNVPPAMIQADQQTTYNNVEQQQIMFRNNLMPWVSRIEDEATRKLIPSFRRDELSCRYRINDLFRSDMETRAKFYGEGISRGWLTINEAREREGLNPVKNGDDSLVQINQISLEQFADYSKKLSSETKA
jgi:HK97 family phage portal protein